jgi:predicted O-methyltransferase YrrM
MLQARKATLQLMKGGLRTARAPLHARTLRRFQKAGLSSRLYPAIAYMLTGELHPRDRAVAVRVEGLRQQLASRGGMTIAEYAGMQNPIAGSPSLGIEQRTCAEIANRVSVPMSFGLFLYLCAEGFGARRILELGACAGISGCYLASAPLCSEFVTLEQSPALASIARANLQAVTRNATVINADFDKGLPAVIGPETAPFDVVWIDGNHEKEATLRYFAQLQQHVAPGGLMLFDDIHWTQGMREAWEIIRSWPGFSGTVTAARLGMAVLKQEDDTGTPRNWHLKRRLGITSFATE